VLLVSACYIIQVEVSRKDLQSPPSIPGQSLGRYAIERPRPCSVLTMSMSRPTIVHCAFADSVQKIFPKDFVELRCGCEGSSNHKRALVPLRSQWMGLRPAKCQQAKSARLSVDTSSGGTSGRAGAETQVATHAIGCNLH